MITFMRSDEHILNPVAYTEQARGPLVAILPARYYSPLMAGKPVAELTVREFAARGGRARARALSPDRRREIACLAVAARERKRHSPGLVRDPGASLDRAYRHARFARELTSRFRGTARPVVRP